MKKITADAADKSSLRMHVYKQIEDAILCGECAPGDSLVELKLSAELGASRTPVREALHQLETDGLVRTVPNKGAVVVGISSKDIEDIYAIRMRIEGYAGRLAAENITQEELDALREVVALQEFYLGRDNKRQLGQLDGQFHEIIYESCRSRPLKHTLSNFHHYIQRARETSINAANRAKDVVEEHRAILGAIAARDGALAEELIAKHMENAKNSVAKLL